MLAAIPAQSLPTPSANLEGIFQQHHGRIFGAAYRITGTAQDAEDVLQTVFLRLLRRQDEVDLSPSPASYLHRAAVNASLDLLRSRSRSRSLPLDELHGELSASDHLAPDRRQHDRELRRCLRQAMLELSEKTAEIFTLRYLEGLQNRDIAELMGISQGRVAVTLHRARGRVRKEMRSFRGGQ